MGEVQNMDSMSNKIRRSDRIGIDQLEFDVKIIQNYFIFQKSANEKGAPFHSWGK